MQFYEFIEAAKPYAMAYGGDSRVALHFRAPYETPLPTTEFLLKFGQSSATRIKSTSVIVGLQTSVSVIEVPQSIASTDIILQLLAQTSGLDVCHVIKSTTVNIATAVERSVYEEIRDIVSAQVYISNFATAMQVGGGRPNDLPAGISGAITGRWKLGSRTDRKHHGMHSQGKETMRSVSIKQESPAIEDVRVEMGYLPRQCFQNKKNAILWALSRTQDIQASIKNISRLDFKDLQVKNPWALLGAEDNLLKFDSNVPFVIDDHYKIFYGGLRPANKSMPIKYHGVLTLYCYLKAILIWSSQTEIL